MRALVLTLMVWVTTSGSFPWDQNPPVVAAGPCNPAVSTCL